ncbi:3'-5' exonuclease [candidate division KSB3 bacterium]|uniref:3'-5' exonuclease n=1 Tax=candidate division KSB3 bacterium TaxID=2044937 RepID=A0A2G6E962_9BACT|nr:MAG: 3'-5' exonuclease [candidate division KSB3 bacterium]PIE29574.1 MAG: 3'-5' exonuclease [candidate division KSB3 bacterium]
MEYEELKTKEAVSDCLSSLETQIICLDLEGEYNLHEYGEKVCLVQIYDGKTFFILDPFKVPREGLVLIFENPRLLKVMYGASSDLSVLKNGHNIECKSILDLQPGLKLLGHRKLNLHAILYACLGIELEQKKKFQKYNWTKRPINADAIDYALGDVKYLFDLKRLIMRQLQDQGLIEQFFLENLILQQKDYTREPGQRLRKTRRFHNFSHTEKERFEGIFAIRERYARQLNLPPHRLLGNQDLLDISGSPILFAQVEVSKGIRRDVRDAFRREIRVFLQNNQRARCAGGRRKSSESMPEYIV